MNQLLAVADAVAGGANQCVITLAAGADAAELLLVLLLTLLIHDNYIII